MYHFRSTILMLVIFSILGDTVYPFLHIEGDAEQPVREITTELRDGNGECYAIVRIR